ncbi:zinc ribbon domain-containing protein [Dapis sp. BLCC M172]|uniref:zinc ribbon domain-containing protein n=1 Tax=Dapis sp. BLCC M172 TaxID=2975281 RepID=UPI003CED352E
MLIYDFSECFLWRSYAFKPQLKYKCELYGSTLVRTDKFYSSSQCGLERKYRYI